MEAPCGARLRVAMLKRTVLIADDDAFARACLKDTLEPAGYDVVEAKDGHEAVRLYREGKPDVVMVDLMMPNKSGLEALTEIRAADPTSRVLVVSSLDSESLQKSALASGAIGYVVKPFHPLEVVDAVERALEMRT